MEQKASQRSHSIFWTSLAVIAVGYVLLLLVLAAAGADTGHPAHTPLPQGLVVLCLFFASAYGVQRLFGLGFLLKLLAGAALVAFVFQRWGEAFLLLCFVGLMVWLWPDSSERRKPVPALPVERMRQLEELRQQELITEAEYRAKRREILADL